MTDAASPHVYRALDCASVARSHERDHSPSLEKSNRGLSTCCGAERPPGHRDEIEIRCKGGAARVVRVTCSSPPRTSDEKTAPLSPSRGHSPITPLKPPLEATRIEHTPTQGAALRPADFLYSRTTSGSSSRHSGTIGITDHSQKELGYVVFIELPGGPPRGKSSSRTRFWGSKIESSRLVSDISSFVTVRGDRGETPPWVDDPGDGERGPARRGVAHQGHAHNAETLNEWRRA